MSRSFRLPKTAPPIDVTTKDGLLDAMRWLASDDGPDQEWGHSLMDDFLEDHLEALGGYDEVVRISRSYPKWFA